MALPPHLMRWGGSVVLMVSCLGDSFPGYYSEFPEGTYPSFAGGEGNTSFFLSPMI